MSRGLAVVLAAALAQAAGGAEPASVPEGPRVGEVASANDIGPQSSAPRGPAGPGPAEPGPAYRLGKKAYGEGRWSESAAALIDAVIANPRDPRARSYLAHASQRLERTRVSSSGNSETLRGYDRELERGRVDAARWTALVEEAGRKGGSGLWLAAADRYLEVLRDNPKHGDALDGLREARREIAGRLDRGGLRSLKEERLTMGFFHYLQRDRKKARREFSAALRAGDGEAELDDGRIEGYLADLRAGVRLPIDGSWWAPTPITPDSAEPRVGAAEPEPAVEPKAAPPRLQTTLAPNPRPRGGLRDRGLRDRGLRNLAERRADALFQQALAQREGGRLAEAAAAVEELLQLQPDYPKADELAFELSEARRVAGQALKAEAETSYRAALGHYGAGRLDESRQALERAVASDPEHPYAKDALERLRRELEEKRR